MTLPPPFPDYLPELEYASDDQTAMNTHSFKHKLVTWLSHERVEENDYIYIEYNDGEKEFMPLFTLTKALVIYNEYLETGDEARRKKFVKLSNRLIHEAEQEGNLAGWKHAKSFVLPGYPPIKRSYSALFQARGLSMLIRYQAVQENPDRRVNELIKGILRTFDVSSDDGGVRKDNSGWYLEYSYGDNSPVVYNGFISSLIGLYEVKQYGPGQDVREKAEEIYDRGKTTLLNNWNDMLFEVGPLTWFRYDSAYLFLVEGSYPDIILDGLAVLADEEPRIRAKLEDLRPRIDRSRWFFAPLEFPYYVYKKLLSFIH